MKRTSALAAALLASCALAGAAHAQGTVPAAGPGDPRIRYVHYDPDQVIDLAGHLGYQMMIEFGPDERIENVSIGDSVSWQVTPNRAANLLFLKPTDHAAATNMTVVTNLRRYTFQLSAFEPGRAMNRVTYDLRFIYPAPPVVVQQAPPQPAEPSVDSLNLNYAFSGSHELYPARVFDDGRFTYFEFPPGADAPAIFVIGPDGAEELVNQQVRDHYTVVDRVAEEFVLRYGKRRARVRNERMSPSHGFLFWGAHRQQEGATHAN
ncbi:MAG: TrbG/VirB9 family P-type conjugative transfer protein [Pseudomonadota bacterium]